MNPSYIDENEFNQLGKDLHRNYGLDTVSNRIYKLAISEYPQSFILYYSYGELLGENNNENAKDPFRKCIDLYKNNSENKPYSQEFENAINMMNKK